MQMECGFHNKNFILICLLLATAAATNVHGQGTKVGFYSRTCPNAESIVRSTVQSYVRGNPALAAGLLRMHFHDCFVRGGHTLGTASCNSFRDRLYNFNGSGGPDPSINPSFLPQLQQQCPQNGDRSTRVALDPGSQNKFDTSYYANMKNGRGILHSDQVLWTDASTNGIVQKYLSVKGLFNVEFGKSMIKMSNIRVKTGSDGEIRKICSAIN